MDGLFDEPLDRLKIRYYRAGDLAEILAIERDCWPEAPWTGRDFLNAKQDRQRTIHVALLDGHLVGYLVYARTVASIDIEVLAVAEPHRRKGIGRKFIGYCEKALAAQASRTRIVARIREVNLDAQLFFRAAGFRCTDILRDYWNHEDALYFVLRKTTPRAPQNRVGRFFGKKSRAETRRRGEKD